MGVVESLVHGTHFRKADGFYTGLPQDTSDKAPVTVHIQAVSSPEKGDSELMIWFSLGLPGETQKQTNKHRPAPSRKTKTKSKIQGAGCRCSGCRARI